MEFEDSKEIYSYVDMLLGQNENGARAIKSSFESFDDVYKKVLVELDSAKTIEEHDRILEKYSDVILLQDNTYIPIIENIFFRKICNRQGLYISEGFAHKVIDNEKIVYTERANINALSKLTSAENIKNGEFISITYREAPDNGTNGRVAAACGAPEKKTYTYDVSNCKNDRRVTTSIYSYWIPSGNNRTLFGHANFYFGGASRGHFERGWYEQLGDFRLRII